MSCSRRRGLSVRAALAGATLLWATMGCASVGPHVWVDDYRDPAPDAAPGYVLGPGDVVQVRVFLQEGLSGRARVRSDGKISLPFLNDVQAAGYEPAALAKQVGARLKDVVNNPVVTVSVEEPRQLQVLVAGEVTHPGLVQVPPESGVLPALVLAGGLSDFAHADRIFVVRAQNGALAKAEPVALRIRFSYPALLHGEGQSAAFRLKPGDQLVVE